MNPLDILWQYRIAFIDGFLVTVELVLFTALIGTGAGAILELITSHFEGICRRAIDAIAFCFAAIPALVVLFWLYYPGQVLFRIDVSPFTTALVALSVMNTFAVYRIIADAVKDFPRQFITTALVCGLRDEQVFWNIQVPLLLRATLPRWIDQQVVILQTSLFASLISVEEIFRVAQRINSVVYQPVPIYTAMALVFLLTAGSAIYYSKYLRNRFHRDFSER